MLTSPVLEELGARPEVVHTLANSKILWVNYEALLTDFPHLKRETEVIIEEWLLRHSAIISDAQIQQQHVNTSIQTTNRRLIAYRPPRYDRAVLVSTSDSNCTLPLEESLRWRDEPEGMLDIKGCGVAAGKKPHLGDHGNGLMLLSQAIEEFARQRLMEAVLRHAKVSIIAVPIYAILDLGFKCRTQEGKMVPAGALVRRAHQRPVSGIELPERGTDFQQIKLEIELLFRQYGITSANSGTELHVFNGSDSVECRYAGFAMPHVGKKRLKTLVDEIDRPLPWHLEGINVQLTRYAQLRPLRAELVDFGHYEIRSRFEKPLLSLAFDRFLQWGGVMWPDDPHWIQPDPKLALCLDVVGTQAIDSSLAKTLGLPEGTKIPAEAILGIELSRRLIEENLDSESFEQMVTSFVSDATASWNDEPNQE